MKKYIIILGILIGIGGVVYALTFYETERDAGRRSVYIENGNVVYKIKKFNTYTKEEIATEPKVITSDEITLEIQELNNKLAEKQALKTDVLIEEAKLT
jgi:hypothetical protein